jgi:hypothetical protein
MYRLLIDVHHISIILLVGRLTDHFKDHGWLLQLSICMPVRTADIEEPSVGKVLGNENFTV